ncbi:hypothetical protein OG264_33535 [Streptomyces xanthophaeus]|uniref:hypothetical protein n=1 Tax=Streptomyces xanthophaeus TaxID=67385 RepID=UPI0038672B6B|nr:hypothetical protein OG264_33535 [Streptomyces xanthophaeus]WST59028.1 hypothetical protein OG605_04905 [Streptomyces xanthophaeus]
MRRVGVDFSDVTDTLERAGLTKFEDSWKDLGASVKGEMHPEAVDTCDDNGSRDGGSESAQLLTIDLNGHYSAATGGLDLFPSAAKGADER